MGRDPSATVDDGWGRIRGEDSSARPFKTKGSWEFARRMLSCNTPVDYFPIPRLGSAMLIERVF